MDNPLQDRFVQLIKNDIENKVLPDLSEVFQHHYPELEIAYKPKDQETFLVGYVIGSLEGNYHTKFIEECGLGAYNEDVYFAIHRFVRGYKEQIIEKVQEYLKD